MADELPSSSGRDREPVEIDRSVASASRVHNYLAGGDDNFAVDRELGEHLSSTPPVDIDGARAAVRALAAFVLRAVRHLAGEVGIRQFLMTGTPPPTSNDVHEVAQKIAPDARVVYVGYDPVVLAHAHELRRGTDEGATAYIHASLLDVPTLLEKAAETLDFTQPMATIMPSTLNFIRDKHDPYGIMAKLVGAMSPGSYLVLAHTTCDIRTEQIGDVAHWISAAVGMPFVLRNHAEIARFFDGLDMVDEGLVHIDQWRRHENRPIPSAETLIPLYGGVARKP